MGRACRRHCSTASYLMSMRERQRIVENKTSRLLQVDVATMWQPGKFSTFLVTYIRDLFTLLQSTAKWLTGKCIF